MFLHREHMFLHWKLMYHARKHKSLQVHIGIAGMTYKRSCVLLFLSQPAGISGF